ncbi:pyruvate dehydrogenase E1 component alpha subunit [Thermanaeromonas toyohensis ToBE]|uniref:Pyruvate dehydrogenase E1 component alpha subunit n=1 Tax=Thermanaeromonas toyohensis ToBE TaxID=698762 RepID=A0A1W1VE48_9FIRM|nr:thiamine pyrophosphate-dependent dehydrogenase E1 component subunit alpha [Thermanaeromonas toyohensis]SMB91648.1 pyruvate dehydrogenase E1 component alpha subunit [Thermanaeromonas toyohensis ToBE]
MNIPKENLLRMYLDMVTIRLYEETMAEAYQEGKHPVFNIAAGPVPGEMHLAAGQEPVAVGVCMHLRKDDTVVGTHRPHHFAIAKGVDLRRMTAEIFGKATGLGRGKGGHMHLFDPDVHFGCSGIIGASIPQAVGAALAFKMRKEERVAVAFFGDGAANQGAFHEGLNLAALWKLPVVFVCEDNSWAISVPKHKSTAINRNADRAVAYGMPGVYVGENDVLAVYEAAGEAVARARRGEGPTLIEVKTDRFFGHFQGDPEVYRPKDEVPRLRQNDPIKRFRNHLLESGIVTEVELDQLDTEARRRVEDAFTFARESPYPAPEEALLHVFVE